LEIKLKTIVICAVIALAVGGLSAWAGYKLGEKKWRGKAVMESYQIGFDQGYSTGCSDASIPDAEVVEVGPDGKIISRRTNPK
jgi:hypothetical protein